MNIYLCNTKSAVGKPFLPFESSVGKRRILSSQRLRSTRRFKAITKKGIRRTARANWPMRRILEGARCCRPRNDTRPRPFFTCLRFRLISCIQSTATSESPVFVSDRSVQQSIGLQPFENLCHREIDMKSAAKATPADRREETRDLRKISLSGGESDRSDRQTVASRTDGMDHGALAPRK